MGIEKIDFDEMDEDELYEYGCDSLEDGDVETALKCITLAAEQGCAEAQFHLAEIYCYGNIVHTDLNEAFKWYKLAAENGDVIAQQQVAHMYRDGTGVEKNFEEYLKWYKLAAENGNRDAMYVLGRMYYLGSDGVEQSYKEAYYWFDKDGFRDLTYYMCADMYFHVDRDYENALRLYKEALLVGDEFAAFKIGEMYYKGLGVEKDYHKSFEFFRNYNSLDDAPIKVYYMLAEMYQNGWGVEQNSEEAEKLFRAAEKRGGIEYDN